MSIRSNMTSTSSRTLPSTFPDILCEALSLRSTESPCPPEILTRLASLPFFHPSRTASAQKLTNRFQHLAHTSGPPKPSASVHVSSSHDRRFTNTTSSQWRPTSSRGDSGSLRTERSSGGSPRSGGRQGGGNRPVDYRPMAGAGSLQRGNEMDAVPRRSMVPLEDGFQVWSPRKVPSKPTDNVSGTSEAGSPSKVEEKHKESESTSDSSPGPKFSSAAVKSSENTEDRILAKVKGKINKIGFTTYDATKVFMQQILDSDETEFLDEFMKFVFQKAATESTFCPLYAKLLHELADQFTHLRVVMNNLFRDYTAIFVEVETTPDVGTEDYKAFLEAQERKKFRRGYSQFVAELVKLGEADEDAFSILIQQIVSVLESAHTTPAKTLVCEEYIDCLANMCMSAPKILSGASWSYGVKGRLKALTELSRASSPGFTNKGRFALMDLVDFANRGWKK
jgi:hypothetical protein